MSDLARALHHSADLLIAKGHGPAAVEEALQLVQAANEVLERGDVLTTEHRGLVFASEMVGALGAPVPKDGERFAAFDRSPFSGAENPLSPTRVEYQRVGDEVHAQVIVGAAYEGATDRSHGGLTAAIFDDLMGSLQRIIGRYGFTRTLEVNYLGRVPIDDVIQYAARLDSEDDRTFTLSSEATYDDEIVATAIAVFTKADFERLATAF